MGCLLEYVVGTERAELESFLGLPSNGAVTLVVDRPKALDNTISVVWQWTTYIGVPHLALSVFCGYSAHDRKVMFENNILDLWSPSLPFYQIHMARLGLDHSNAGCGGQDLPFYSGIKNPGWRHEVTPEMGVEGFTRKNKRLVHFVDNWDEEKQVRNISHERKQGRQQ